MELKVSGDFSADELDHIADAVIRLFKTTMSATVYDEEAKTYHLPSQVEANLRQRFKNDLSSVNKMSSLGKGIEPGTTSKAAGLEARWQTLKSAAPTLRAVVIDEALAKEHPALYQLAGLEERFFVDRPEARADTVWALYQLGVGETLYYGGLEAARTFQAVAQGLVEVTPIEATAATLYRHLLNILSRAGIPDNVLAAGLEQFGQELKRLSPEA